MPSAVAIGATFLLSLFNLTMFGKEMQSLHRTNFSFFPFLSVLWNSSMCPLYSLVYDSSNSLVFSSCARAVSASFELDAATLTDSVSTDASISARFCYKKQLNSN